MAFAFFTFASLFGCMLPIGIFSVIWEQISANMTVGIPNIAILRTLAAFGAVAGVILSDRIRQQSTRRDVTIGALSLQALTMCCFSLSRVFWNLCAWSLVLGFSMGLGTALTCRLLRGQVPYRTGILFAGSPAGAGAGAVIMTRVTMAGGNWRTACQVLAIVEVLLCLLLFFLRRSGLKTDPEAVRRTERERTLRRSSRREALVRGAGDVDERSVAACCARMAGAYAAAACCGLLLLADCLWPALWCTESGTAGPSSAEGIIIVCAGIAAGRILSAFVRISDQYAWALGCALAGAALALCAAVLLRGGLSDMQLRLVQFAVGCGVSRVFPGLVLLDDERFDPEVTGSAAGMIPAFCMGSWALITPVTQALSGGSGGAMFAVWMLALCAIMALCLAVSAQPAMRRENG